MNPSQLVIVSVMIAGLTGCSRDAPKPVPPIAPPSTAAADPAPAPIAPAHDSAAASPLPPGHPAVDAPLPAGHPPMDQASGGFTVAPPTSAAGAGSTGLQWTVPKSWTAETPSSAMRKAQYKVPGAAGDAQCVVFYFGPGQGGDAQSNAARWASQFKLADGRDGQTAMKTRDVTVGAMKVLMVEVAGTYIGGMGGDSGEKTGYMLVGAVAQGPDANWFFKLTGPEKTVTAQRGAFEEMVKSLKKGA